MAGLKVTINNKGYNLKFGYGVFRRLGDFYGVVGFQGLGTYIQDLDFGNSHQDLTFPQLNFLGNLIIAAAEYASNKPIKLDLDQVIDNVVLGTPEMLGDILQEFTDSFPKEQGKPNPATRKKTAKK